MNRGLEQLWVSGEVKNCKNSRCDTIARRKQRACHSQGLRVSCCCRTNTSVKQRVKSSTLTPVRTRPLKYKHAMPDRKSEKKKKKHPLQVLISLFISDYLMPAGHFQCGYIVTFNFQMAVVLLISWAGMCACIKGLVQNVSSYTCWWQEEDIVPRWLSARHDVTNKSCERTVKVMTFTPLSKTTLYYLNLKAVRILYKHTRQIMVQNRI